MLTRARLAAARTAPPGLVGAAAPLLRPFRGTGLRASMVRGSAWTIGGYGASQVIRLASNLTLTRLLFPEAFGMMMMVLTVVQGLQMFSDVGIGTLIVQSKRGDDPDFLRTAWTVQIVRGFMLWGVSFALAAPAAAYFGEPDVLWLLPFVGLQLIAGGFQSTSFYTCNRNLTLGRLTTIQLIAQAISVVVMIAWAMHHRSVLALAVGAVLTPMLTSIMTHTSLPGVSHRLRWEWEAVRELFSFGKWVFVSTLLTFLAMQSDRLIFGRLVDADTLGVYAIAVNLTLLGISILNRLSGRVLHPAYSQLLNRGECLADHLPRIRFPASIFAGAASAGLAACAVPLVAVMYDDRYQAAAWMLMILSGSCLLQSMDLTLNRALLACGRPRDLAMSNAARLVGLVLFLPLGFYLGGIRPGWNPMAGALVGLVISDVLRYATTVLLAWRAGLPSLSQDLPVIGYTVLSAVMVLALGEWIGLARFGEWLALACSALAVAVLWTPWVPAMLRRVRRGAGAFMTAGSAG